MRWKMPPNPEYGDTRTRLVFAWLPKRIDDHIVFLERFELSELYGHFYCPLGFFPGWIEISKSLCFPKQPEQL